jgi:hypothetical protein
MVKLVLIAKNIVILTSPHGTHYLGSCVGHRSVEAKQPELEADHSHLSRAEVKNIFSYTSWRGAQLSTGKILPVHYLTY